MYGLRAISAANGWVISLAGICIVYSGLVVLYLFTSNLERLLRLWERKGTLFKRRGEAPIPVEAPTAEVPAEIEQLSAPEVDLSQLTPEQQEVAAYFEMIVRKLGKSFSLPVLLEHAEKRGIRKPHFHLYLFLRMNLIEECEGEWIGFYRWRKK